MAMQINSVEAKWLSPICSFVKTLYKSAHIPSHDISHHLRVWHICNNLVKRPLISQNLNPAISSEHLIVACLFHDTGLTVDKSERHGYASAKFCSDFFKKTPQLAVDNLRMVLYAIEHHDDKSIQQANFKDLPPELQLTRILSTADDLDAFGLIGVYRYVEIYVLRGIALHHMPAKVLMNIANRHKNFTNLVGVNTAFYQKHTRRYAVTVDFFKGLQEELNSGNDGNGQCTYFAKSIIHNVINKEYTIEQTIKNELVSLASYPRKNLFSQLKDELNQFTVF
ncbi:MAG TPA: HD domain-containing protein [Bacteroidetes bacterium]|nr:HD domain-containing protein [Bacteroidota bacterium]